MEADAALARARGARLVYGKKGRKLLRYELSDGPSDAAITECARRLCAIADGAVPVAL